MRYRIRAEILQGKEIGGSGDRMIWWSEGKPKIPPTPVCNLRSRYSLPAPGDGGDDLAQSIEIAEVDDLSGRVRVAKRPAESHVSSAIDERCCTIIAAAGDSILRRNVGGVGDGDDFLDQVLRDYVGVINGADDEAFAEESITEAGRFERRIGTDEGIDGKDVVGSVPGGIHVFGGRCCALQAKLFTGGPDESYVTIDFFTKRPRCGNKGSAAYSVIKGACAGTVAHQLMELLGDGDKVALLDAQLGGLFGIMGANVHMEHGARAAWPLKVGFVPAFRKFDHARMNAVAGVHKSSMTKEVSQYAAAFGFKLKTTVRKDGMNFIADLIHVRDDGDLGCLASGWGGPVEDEVAGVVSFRLGPQGEQRGDGLAHVGFMSAADAVGFDQVLNGGGDGGSHFSPLVRRFRKRSGFRQADFFRRAGEIRFQQRDERRDIMSVNDFSRRGRPLRGHGELNSARRKRRLEHVSATRKKRCGEICFERNVRLRRDLLKIGGKSGGFSFRLFRGDQHAAADVFFKRRSRFMVSIAACGGSGSSAAHETADEDEFVWFEVIDETLQAAGSEPLLSDESECYGALDLGWVNVANEFEQSRVAKAIAHGGCRELSTSQGVEFAIDRERAENVGATGAGFRRRCGTYVNEHVVEIRRHGWMLTLWLQVNGNTRNRAVDPCARFCSDFYWLRGIKFIEERQVAALRKALQSEVAFRSDVADDVAGLVHWRGDQAMRRTGAESEGDVALLVGDDLG